MEDTDSILERQTLNLNPDMWTKLYRDRVYDELGVPITSEEEIELTENDLSELDKFMDAQEAQFQANLLGKHTMTGASTTPNQDLRSALDQAEPLSWGEWQ